MIWVLFATIGLYVLANLPLVYSLLRVHGFRGIAQLWGFAPNQFLFLSVVFPFVALYAFLSLRILIVDIRASIPLADPGRIVLEYWPAWLTAALALVSVVTVIVYFASAMSLDKLRPEYARVALKAIDEFDVRMRKVPERDRAAKRAALIQSAKTEADALTPPSGENEAEVSRWLSEQEPEVTLQLLVSPASQLRLRLLDPTIHALNVLQMLIGLFVGAVTMVTTVLTIHAARVVGFPTIPSNTISELVSLLGTALVFLALYPFFYHQLRIQLQEYVGSGFSVLQDFFVAALVLGVLVMLNRVEPAEKILSITTVGKYLPIAVITGGFVVDSRWPEILRQLLGRSTTWGIQLLMTLFLVLIGFFPLLAQLFSRR